MSELFGTDGIRGVAGEELSSRTAFALGNALARLKQEPMVVVGEDTRVSSDMLALALSAGVASGGGTVLWGGVLPTAAISRFVVEKKADFGVVVSASHNPAKYNGLKVFGKDGRKLAEKQERRVEHYMRSEYSFAGPLSMGRLNFLRGEEEYIAWLAGCCARSLKGKKFAVDCANGAAGRIAPEVFRRLGAEVVASGTNRGGLDVNEGCGALHPERIRAMTLESGADAGFAYDGDAARLIACDDEVNIVDGHKIICILAAKLKKDGKLRENVVVGTSHTNTGAEEYLKKLGIRLIRTDIGDKYVSDAMQKSGAQVGGEQSGHVILSDYAVTGDGILTSVKLAELAAGKKLSRLADIKLLPQYNACVRVKDKVRVLGDEHLRDFIDRTRGGVSRLVVRASGTEPVVRIFAEAESMKQAKYAVERIKAEISAAEEG